MRLVHLIHNKVFDKVSLLYEGRQIFFGSTDTAKAYFINLGFVCADRATTADFLTSVTNPSERIVQVGLESQAPRTTDEFQTCWKNSPERQKLVKEIEEYEKEFPVGSCSSEVPSNANKRYGFPAWFLSSYTDTDKKFGLQYFFAGPGHPMCDTWHSKNC